MTQRSRTRFDPIVLAAAVTAVVAGITAGVSTWIGHVAETSKIKADARLEICREAHETVIDDRLNPELDTAHRVALANQAYDITMRCSKEHGL